MTAENEQGKARQGKDRAETKKSTAMSRKERMSDWRDDGEKV
jgi:hypothetical protein